MIIVNRDATRGQELTSLLRTAVKAQVELVPWRNDYVVPRGVDVVINATSIGLYPDIAARLALDTSSLTSAMVVADVIPNPPDTKLLHDARARGCQVIDGLSMLVNQGIIGVEYWTGITPNATAMRQALEQVFA
jgi:shikimate dehydrogenase